MTTRGLSEKDLAVNTDDHYREAIAAAAEAIWGAELGTDAQLAHDDGDDGILAADGGVWVKAWLWLSDADIAEETASDESDE